MSSLVRGKEKKERERERKGPELGKLFLSSLPQRATRKAHCKAEIQMHWVLACAAPTGTQPLLV